MLVKFVSHEEEMQTMSQQLGLLLQGFHMQISDIIIYPLFHVFYKVTLSAEVIKQIPTI